MLFTYMHELKLWLYPSLARRAIIALGLVVILAACYSFVLKMGGTKTAYIHLTYIPIIMAGFFFSAWGGALFGILAGIVMGPLLPLDTVAETTQPIFSWATRIWFFVLAGVLSGFGSMVYRKYFEELRRSYSTNPVSGLPNRAGMTEVFDEIKDKHSELVVTVIDIHNFRELQLAIGPAGVESIMQQIAQQLLEVTPNTVFIGHSQTSGFMIISTEETETNAFVLHLQSTLSKTYYVDNIPVYADLLFGVSSYPDDSSDFSDLVRKARLAIRHDERQTKAISVYSAALEDDEPGNASLLHELHQALEKSGLELFYQPKVDSKTQQVVGVEALTRWNHPERGYIPPSDFIRLTEHTLLIHPFTRWMLDQALKDLSKWRKEGITLQMAVNFSMKNFHDKTIVKDVLTMCTLHDIDPSMLEIEVTESAVTNDMEQVAETMKEFRKHKIKVTIDDFGTGQASQQYLFELPLDGLKVDRIFINDLGQNTTADAIVQSAIFLGHQLDLQVTAEGVETAQQMELLQKFDCDNLQGFIFAKALESNEFIKWLRARKPKLQPVG